MMRFSVTLFFVVFLLCNMAEACMVCIGLGSRLIMT